MDKSRQEICASVARQVSRAYARRVWWAEEDDLVQESWAVLLETDRKRVLHDDTYRAYMYRVCAKHLSRYLWRQSSPVSHSAPEKLVGTKRVSLAADTNGGMEPPFANYITSKGSRRAAQRVFAEDFEAKILRAEAELLITELRGKLRSRVSRLCEKAVSTWHSQDALMGGASVLVDGIKPTRAAQLACVDVTRVYRATTLLKAHAERDVETVELLAELQERRADYDNRCYH